MLFFVRNLLILAVLIFVAFTGVIFWNAEGGLPERNYSQFLQSLDQGLVQQLQLQGDRLTVTEKQGFRYVVRVPAQEQLFTRIDPRQVQVEIRRDLGPLVWQGFALLIPSALVLLLAVALLRRRETDGGTSERFAAGKRVHFQNGSRAVTLQDVAGIPEAQDELREIIDFLKNPQPFREIGATIPRGVLLQGPPGTGKTLLARAIAGEAGVPFLSLSGSDFVEMFVGVGASRVRELFEQARRLAPCIVFIDEIDAVGSSRGSGASAGGQEERGQTLNALLVEMDGFASDDAVLVLAATNRPDILDSALRRPGRFDRVITILPPDVKGRRQILEVHTRKVRLAEGIDLGCIAQATPGFTGAELANLVNEAALLAARRGRDTVGALDFDAARDRLLLGVERKGLVISEQDRRLLAFHEAGHAIIARRLPDSDPVHKITIIPRGRALGQTQQLPLGDRQTHTERYLRQRIIVLMGGRAAEEIVLGQRSTGAQDDLLQATDIALHMVGKWGMNERVGPRALLRDQGSFLADETWLVHGEAASQCLDQEVDELLRHCADEARAMLERDRELLHNLAEILLQTETVDSEELEIILHCNTTKQGADSATQAVEDAAACSVPGVNTVAGRPAGDATLKEASLFHADTAT
ncbi:MAG: cell division protein FtsH [Desulfobulbaceae bacterium A2]|nr:MAG: cell division protein FtsH [Desulfobulbaceae bacterium A2]